MARKSASPRRARASDASLLQTDRQPEAAPSEPNPPRKRGRPRKSTDSDARAPGTKGKRTSLGRKTVPGAAAAAGPSSTTTQPSRRGRPRKSDEAPGSGRDRETQPQASRGKKRVSFHGDAGEEAQAAQPPPKRKRGRPSLKELAARAAAEQDATTTTTTNTTEPPPPAQKRRGRKSSSTGQKPTPRRGRRSSGGPDDADDADDASYEPSRRRSSQMAQLEADAPPKPYAHVAPRVRTIRQSTIDDRWSPLNATSIAAASETLALAHRPVMQRVAGNTQRRRHTSSALTLLHRRICRKLERGLPFPPTVVAPATATAAAAPRRRGRPRGPTSRAGVEAEMDFETVLDGSQALERQLDPALHAVELLTREREHMERELERDYKTLRNLEAGATAQARAQREQLKKAHALVPEAVAARRGSDQEGEERERERDDVGAVVFDHQGAVPPGTVFKDILDEELKGLALQFGGHVESMRANLGQVEGVTTQMAESGTALRSLLLRLLDGQGYRKVVLG